MASVRPPAVAGSFYPADPRELRDTVADLLADADAGAEASGGSPKALVAPHAGYVYSGPVAASAYARLRGRRESVTTVVLLGPAHRVWFEGLALPSCDALATPLGLVRVRPDARQALADLPQVQVLDAAYAGEHSLEVHLPFLQVALGAFEVVPLIVGEATPAQVAEVIDRLWGGPETLVVVSSDLSHYLDYASARRADARTTRAIEQARFEELGEGSACGRVPLSGLLLAARRRGLAVKTLDVRNSGDTAGPRDSVVGYGAWALH